MTCSVTPARRPSASRSRSSASACSTTSMPASSRTGGHQRAGDLRAGGVAARVRDAVAEVAALAGQRDGAGRRRGRSARPGRSARAPPPGPSVTSTRTASSSHSPTPATSVSCRCCLGESSSASAAAMPPCAHRVEPSLTCALVTSSTVRPMRARAQGRRQPGDAGADHDDVGARGPARARRPRSRRAIAHQRPQPARATLSMSRVRPHAGRDEHRRLARDAGAGPEAPGP